MALTKITGKGIGAVDEITSDTAGTSNFVAGVNAGDAIASGGNNNTCVGDEAGTAVTTGTRNTFTGTESGKTITTTLGNTFYGYRSGLNSTAQLGTFIGDNAGQNATGNNNTLIGQQAGYLITSGANNTIIGRYDGNQDDLDIRTASNYVVLSDGDGNLAGYRIGTSGGRQWHLIADADNDVGFAIKNKTSANPYGVAIQFPNEANNNGSQYFLACADSSANRFIVSNNGNVTNQNNSYGAISDVKLKEQITDASSQWEDIKALTVRKYKMKEEVSAKGDSDALWRLGVVAQEVETAGLNGLVEESPDRDSEMNDLGTTTKTVKYSILYMKAVKALQEAMTRIETLETENATQATQIADLISRVTALENA